MIVSIMQPYLFPYLGYFQLIHHSQNFIFYDDVQYKKNGWINRNRILRDGNPRWLTLPVIRTSRRLSINERYYQLDQVAIRRFLRQIEAAYRKAPRFDEIFWLISDIMSFQNPNVACFNMQAVRRISRFIGIDTRLALSSDIGMRTELKAVERVLELCRRFGATQYVNPIGGMQLYTAERFGRFGIDLRFLKPAVPPYAQFGHAPVPDLSIIDVLMFNQSDTVSRLLQHYHLIDPTAGI